MYFVFVVKCCVYVFVFCVVYMSITIGISNCVIPKFLYIKYLNKSPYPEGVPYLFAECYFVSITICSKINIEFTCVCLLLCVCVFICTHFHEQLNMYKK